MRIDKHWVFIEKNSSPEQPIKKIGVYGSVREMYRDNDIKVEKKLPIKKQEQFLELLNKRILTDDERKKMLVLADEKLALKNTPINEWELRKLLKKNEFYEDKKICIKKCYVQRSTRKN